jgi:hypothetical protein
MSAAASDYYLCGRALPQAAAAGAAAAGAETAVAEKTSFVAVPTVPPVPTAPPVRSQLYRYLFRRAMDSFRMGESVLRFAQWMALDEDGPNGTARLTFFEFEKLLSALDQQRLVPVGLLISEGRDLRKIFNEVWLNHQVLAYGYRKNEDGTVDVRVYDPNSPSNDDVYIHTTRITLVDTPDGPLYGIHCQPVHLNISPPRIRGFFIMPYDPADPPDL